MSSLPLSKKERRNLIAQCAATDAFDSDTFALLVQDAENRLARKHTPESPSERAYNLQRAFGCNALHVHAQEKVRQQMILEKARAAGKAMCEKSAQTQARLDAAMACSQLRLERRHPHHGGHRKAMC